MLIAEELMLVALDPERGTSLNSAGQSLGPCLAGALVGELALSEGVILGDRRFEAGGHPPSDPLLVHALARLLRTGGRSKNQIRKLSGGNGRVRDEVVDRLVEAKVVGRRDDRVLLWHVTRHPVLRPDLRDEVVLRLRAAAAGDGEIEPRTAVLLALAGPARLLEVVAPDKPRDHAKKRIAEASDLAPVAALVKKVIQEAQTAATTAAVAGGVAATAGGASS